MKLNPAELEIAAHVRELRRKLLQYQKATPYQTRVERFLETTLNPLVSDVADMKLGYELEEPPAPANPTPK